MVFRRVSVMTLVVLLVVAAFVTGRSSHSTASASPTTTTALPASTTFYLVLGGSSSLGIQPDGVPSNDAELTTNGYANDVAKLELIELHQYVDLVQIGCLGTRVIWLTIDPTSNMCYKVPTTQLTTAVAFLKAHQSDTGIVSIDLGFNDVRYCLWEHPIDSACVSTALAGVTKGFPAVLDQLKAAAGPKVALVGLTYYDPFLAFYLNGPSGPSYANVSLSAIDQLNTILAADYKAAGIPYADGAAAFNSSDTTRIPLDNVGTIPANVEAICTYTWMCVGHPFGPDDHPNNAGYMLIARAIVAALPAPWRISTVK